MNILIVTPFRNYPGGVETFNAQLSLVFQKAGHQVDYLTSEQTSENEKSFLRRFVGTPAITAKKFGQLKKHYDVVICNGEFSWGIKHPNLINIFHGSYLGLRDFQKGTLTLKQYLSLTWQSFIQKWAAKGHTVVAVSSFVAGILKKQGIKVSSIIEIGVDTDLFSPHTSSLTTFSTTDLFVGSYNYYGKGFDVLESLAKKGLHISCVTNQKPSALLNWLPSKTHQELPEVYRAHHLLIFPSRFEAGGLVPLEAMACGIPILMGRTGYGIDIEKEIPEFVVSEITPENFLEKREYIDKNYTELSRRARDYVLEKHSLNHFSSEWLKLIKKLSV